MRASTAAVASASVLALLQFPAAHAALCSVDEMDTINNIDSTSSAPSDCYVVSLLSNTEWNQEVCQEHADCIPYLKTMVDELPDCSYLGVNVHDSIAEAVANCEAVASSSNSTSTTSSSTALCTTDEVDTINTIDSTSSAPSDCYVVSLLSDSEWNKEVCEEHADCIPYLKTMVDELPDCSYLGVNVHDSIAEAVANCEAVTSSSNSTSTSTSTNSSSTTTSSTTSSSSTSSDVGSSDPTTSSAETGNSASKTAGTFFMVTATVVASLALQ